MLLKHTPVKNCFSPLDAEHATSSAWFPPEVTRSFLTIWQAYQRRRYSKVDYLSHKYRNHFPAYAGYYLDMEAGALRDRDRKAEALECLIRANDFFQNTNLSVCLNLIDLLLDLKKTEEAEAYVKQGLVHFPKDSGMQEMNCLFLEQQGRVRDALDSLRSLCQTTPTSTAWCRLGDFCFENGRHREGMAAYEKALKLDPHFSIARCNQIFLAHYMPEYTQKDLGSLIHEWHDTICAPLPITPPTRLQRKLVPDKKLRIGFLSPGFCMHPVGWMASRSLWFLSKLSGYELYFYSLNRGPNEEDSVRSRFRNAATKWVPAEKWDSERLYRKAIDDQLDIAVDLAGHGEGCVLPLFVRRIAPVQVKWVGGLFNTTGVPEMDYLLTDRYETPEGCDTAYTEKLVRLPHSYISYDLRDFGDTERLPDSEDGDIATFRFASFNKLCKFNEAIIGVWAEILKQVPKSVLLLKNDALKHAETRDFVRDLFTAQGIAPHQLELEPPSRHWDLMRTYRKVDIALDTWPYTGGVTTLEALWMGVPVVTTPGPSFAGRHALSHLCNTGLESLVAKDFEEYVKIAVTLAGDRRLLADLRILLPYSLATSPIVRHHQLAADLHTAFRAMWERHCAGLPPVAMRFEQPSEIPDVFKPFIPDMPKKRSLHPPKGLKFPFHQPIDIT